MKQKDLHKQETLWQEYQEILEWYAGCQIFIQKVTPHSRFISIHSWPIFIKVKKRRNMTWQPIMLQNYRILKKIKPFPKNGSMCIGWDYEDEKNLDVIWYNISGRSSFCSNLSCIVANPIRRGSRSPTRQLLISTPFFCLGFISVGLASNNRSFSAPTKTAQKHIIMSQNLEDNNVPTWSAAKNAYLHTAYW